MRGGKDHMPSYRYTPEEFQWQPTTTYSEPLLEADVFHSSLESIAHYHNKFTSCLLEEGYTKLTMPTRDITNHLNGRISLETVQNCTEDGTLYHYIFNNDIVTTVTDISDGVTKFIKTMVDLIPF